MQVIGYHGTSLESAEEIVNRRFKGDAADQSPPRKLYRWLGKGLYLFQENKILAEKWARKRFGNSAAVVKATIDLTDCMDLVAGEHLPLLSAIYLSMIFDTASSQSIPTQMPFTIRDGEVKTAWDPNWRGYGINRLDYSIIEQAVAFYATDKWEVRSVRGIFLEGRELYPTSYLFDEAHVCIAIRPPYERILDLCRVTPSAP